MKIFYLVLMSAAIASCNQNNSASTNEKSPINRDSLRNELMNTDKSWSAASLEKGYYHSRIDFVADDGIELTQGKMPLLGKAAITDYAANNSDSTVKVQWTALKGDVAASGDFGYTYGSYTDQMKTKAGKDTTVYGAYVTVWQKQADGSWKFLADASDDSPQPVK
jgi:ketosteroid isomerase-like protein